MTTDIELFYDAEADILEVFIGEPRASYFDEVDEGVYEGHAEDTGELTGFKIFDFKERSGKDVRLRLPAHVRIEATK